MATRHWLFNQWKTAIRNVVHIDLQNHLMLNDLIDKIYAIAEMVDDEMDSCWGNPICFGTQLQDFPKQHLGNGKGTLGQVRPVR